MQIINKLNWSNRINKFNGPWKQGGVLWSSYWATLISATVENDAPIGTFPEFGCFIVELV